LVPVILTLLPVPADAEVGVIEVIWGGLSADTYFLSTMLSRKAPSSTLLPLLWNAKAIQTELWPARFPRVGTLVRSKLSLVHPPESPFLMYP